MKRRRIEGADHLASVGETMKDQYQLLPRSRWKPQWLPSPISLPESRSGAMCIKHVTIPAGGELDIVSFREALLSGTRPAKVKLTEPLIIHHLVEDLRGIWMSDLPCEINQMAAAIFDVKPRGSVLVGGLGLGILPGLLRDLAAQYRLKGITVLEKSADVIKLCRQPGYEMLQMDALEHLKIGPLYDTYMLDTWQGQNEMTWWEYVFPQRRTIGNRHGEQRPAIWCWKEREMWGQIYRSLRGPNRHWFYEQLPPSMPHDQALAFLRDVGMPQWERMYGQLQFKSK